MVYALLFLILLGWGLNVVSQKYGLQNVIYRREISRSVVEIDEEFQITTILENNKLLPVTFLQVTEKFPAMLNYKFKADLLATVQYVFHKTTLLLKPYERVSRVYTVFARQRGQYTFKEVTLAGGDLLGLNYSHKEVEFEQKVLVLPKSLPISGLQPYGDYYGNISVRRWIIDDPILLTGVREYTGFESERTIHWPSSLKAGRLMVKQFDYTAENSVMILLNIECSRPSWFNINQEKVEQCISLARGVLDELEQAGIPYGFCTDAYVSGASNKLNTIHQGIGAYHYSEIVESLGRIINSLNLNFEDLLRNFARLGGICTTYILITPTVLEPYIWAMNELSAQTTKIILISLDETNFEHLPAILKFKAPASESTNAESNIDNSQSIARGDV
ncbi:DUF58 domain-containing protein [Desulfosporosinus sp. PR]|uniref:DUF58 domain-containing protein n=1 Tax=Candidatus Desulfosporosinus nitrosoreducens TaxID=3401928 RepID=UPI0027F9D662|nr:DUF58 domain-containing protein [Desulfosporosinus sp. PR]MDQ7096353.1 DUF58 domain-containing protein [Desulfosporosinus sp. PR]